MSSNLNTYRDLEGFSGVYLEDSYVLEITQAAGEITFVLDLVLTPDHRAYSPPQPDEARCFRPAVLRFPNVARATWRAAVVVPSRDAKGEVDYGNIDGLVLRDGEYEVSGDWGVVAIQSDPPRLELLAAAAAKASSRQNHAHVAAV